MGRMIEIKLTQNQVTVVDDKDKWVTQYKWCAHKDSSVKWKNQYYAERGQAVYNRLRTIGMHRAIMEQILLENCLENIYYLFTRYPRIYQVDHINGNTLDNRRSNLRIVNNRENCQNLHCPKSSQYAGVTWISRDRKWQAKISIEGIHKHLGYFSNEKDAKNAYDKAIEELNQGKIIDELTTYHRDFGEYKGISWHSGAKKWRARVTINGKEKYIGLFKTRQEAKQARDVFLEGV